MTTDFLIREARPGDRPAWQDLWQQYLVFYDADLPVDRTEVLWRRIFDPDDPVTCLVAESDGAVVGIAHFFEHPDTWEDRPVCYLEDLFVDESHRRSGIATGLIDELRRRCRENGWPRLYWTTMTDNRRARSVYDAITGGANGHIVYEVELPAL
jgi:GNAT superfamily N-acetyltransferase